MKPETPNGSGLVFAASRKVSGAGPPACGLFPRTWKPELVARLYPRVTPVGRFVFEYRVHERLPWSVFFPAKVYLKTQFVQVVGLARQRPAQSHAVLILGK